MRGILKKIGLVAAIICALFVSTEPNTMNAKPEVDLVYETFSQALNVRGFTLLRKVDEDVYEVKNKDGKRTVSLRNGRKQFLQDKDAEGLKRFVDRLLIDLAILPNWNEAKARVRLQVEPADHDFGKAIHEKISDVVSFVAVYVSADGAHITWIDESQLKTWKIGREELVGAAKKNLNHLVNAAKLEVQDIDGMKLGFLSVNTESESAFKASLILAPALKTIISKELGWPVHAVIPARDFLYLVPLRDKGLIPRIGRVVVGEYSKSAYPLTTEVFVLSDEKADAIGAFPVETKIPAKTLK